MIFGIGIDVVDIARFEESLVRTPTLKVRLFKPSELDRPIHSLARSICRQRGDREGYGFEENFHWQDVEIINLASGKPTFQLMERPLNSCAARKFT
jgi:holo-[acyl-carrier protein] synthase